MRVLARTHGIVLPVSYFERDGDRFYNSLALFDADGREVGHYRKSHIPDGPGYEEKTLLLAGRHRLRRVRHGASAGSASASAGTSGSPSARAR